MRIGIPKERLVDETRVATTPKTIKQLLKLGFTVVIECGAGKLANFNDEAFVQAGADIMEKNEVWKSPIILKVNAPEQNEISLLHAGTTLISFIWPAQNPELVQSLAARNITVIAMDLVPRISRAQSLDALSSMDNITGYRAIIEAAHEFGRFFTGQMTAAGSIPPAKVMVIGAGGVTGLSAIRTANSLGAIVRAFDIRPEVKEQVQSMGAEFLELDYKEVTKDDNGYATVTSKSVIEAEIELLASQIREVDIVITTVFVPGKPTLKLLTRDMINTMKPGSIIVDLAAQSGGNCEYTTVNQIITTANGVKVIGYTNLPNRLPIQSSQLYSTNLVNLLKLLCKEKDGNITIDFDDVIVRNMTVIREGKITWPAPPIQAFTTESRKKETVAIKKEIRPVLRWKKYSVIVLTITLFGWLANVAPKEFLSHFTIFALSCVASYHVMWNVSHALHTPLMSITNAISGIIIIGAVLQIKHGGWINFLSFTAVLLSAINIFGGFTVTQRMLKMFRKR